MSRYARRTDANHTEIAKAFRELGFAVADTSRLGDGFLDLVVSKNQRTAIVEVKDGEKPASARKLTSKEAEFIADWQGITYIVTSVDDVIRIAHLPEWTE